MTLCFSSDKPQLTRRGMITSELGYKQPSMQLKMLVLLVIKSSRCGPYNLRLDITLMARGGSLGASQMV
jgi:hypothetical protein